MNEITIRPGKKTFTNVMRFPYGFKKSGDFSITEASILSEYGETLQSLEMGSIKPVSKEEKRFVKMTKKLVLPITTVEQAWLKYSRLTNTKKNFYTLNSACSNEFLRNEYLRDAEENNLEFEV